MLSGDQLMREYVSVRKLGEGEDGRVMVCERGTETKVPSTASMSSSGSGVVRA